MTIYTTYGGFDKLNHRQLNLLVTPFLLKTTEAPMNQKKIYYIENPEFSESDIQEIDYGCFTWSDEIFDDTIENAKLHSVVKKIINHDVKAMDVALGIISEFSGKFIKLSVPCLAEDGKLISSDELIAEYKNIEELIADGWGINEKY